MKKIYIFIFFFLVLLFPLKTKAYSCSYEERANLRKLASNITTSYDPVISDNKATFNITINNLFNNLLLKDVTNNKDYVYSSSNNGEIKLYSFGDGNKYKFEVYSNLSGCDNSLLDTFYITLPYYNQYYNDNLCSNIKGYKYCQKWLTYRLDYETFKAGVQNYEQSNNENTNEEENKVSVFDKMINFFIDNYVYIYGTIIIVSVVAIYILNKRDSFNL